MTQMTQKKIGVLVGSARRESINQKMADAFIPLLAKKFDVQQLKISHLPIFCQDYDDDGKQPQSWVEFRAAVGEKDAFLFFTPEYNRSVPPLLKNALDIASRPYGQNKWSGKPGAIISVSNGAIGGFGANHHLRQSMSFLNVFMMQQPETYLTATKCLDEQGKPLPDFEGFLNTIVQSFTEWVEHF